MSLIGLLFVVLFVVYIMKTIIKPKNYPPGSGEAEIKAERKCISKAHLTSYYREQNIQQDTTIQEPVHFRAPFKSLIRKYTQCAASSGPRWYPYFGCNNIIHANARKHGSQWKAISEMSKEYGTQVLGLKMGSELVVVVSGEKNIHFVSEEMNFDARPDSFFIKLRTFGKRSGITFVDGPLWRNQRLFTMKGLRNEGFGKEVMESDIQEEINNLLNKLRNSNRKSVDISLFISMSTANILWKYVAGEHLKDSTLKKFISLMGSRSKIFTMAGGWLNQWPWLRFIAPKWSGFSIIQGINVEMVEIIQEAINKHKEKTVEGSDFMYKYLVEMCDKKLFFTEDQLRAICMDLLIASAQTTSSVLGFAIIILLRNKDIYNKIYNEINTILGKDLPRMTDYVRLVYTSAFLLEIQRKFTIAPFSGPRRALKDTIIDGYCVPKGTTILISIGDLHSDPKLWDEPDEIKPERFIDERGSLKNNKNFYPFGVGRRACPGRPLSKSFLFLVFVSVIQKFKIECNNGILPSDEPFIGLFAVPKPFTVRFTEIV